MLIAIVKKAAANHNVITQSESMRKHLQKHKESGVWKKDTVLIICNSMLFNIYENTLSKYKRFHIKVRRSLVSTVLDLHDYIKPLLRKQPDKIILDIGTNDIAQESVNEILKCIKLLINFFHEKIRGSCHGLMW